jgi:hypothetical protein
MGWDRGGREAESVRHDDDAAHDDEPRAVPREHICYERRHRRRECGARRRAVFSHEGGDGGAPACGLGVGSGAQHSDDPSGGKAGPRREEVVLVGQHLHHTQCTRHSEKSARISGECRHCMSRGPALALCAR